MGQRPGEPVAEQRPVRQPRETVVLRPPLDHAALQQEAAEVGGQDDRGHGAADSLRRRDRQPPHGVNGDHCHRHQHPHLGEDEVGGAETGRFPDERFEQPAGAGVDPHHRQQREGPDDQRRHHAARCPAAVEERQRRRQMGAEQIGERQGAAPVHEDPLAGQQQEVDGQREQKQVEGGQRHRHLGRPERNAEPEPGRGGQHPQPEGEGRGHQPGLDQHVGFPLGQPGALEPEQPDDQQRIGGEPGGGQARPGAPRPRGDAGTGAGEGEDSHAQRDQQPGVGPTGRCPSRAGAPVEDEPTAHDGRRRDPGGRNRTEADHGEQREGHDQPGGQRRHPGPGRAEIRDRSPTVTECRSVVHVTPGIGRAAAAGEGAIGYRTGDQAGFSLQCCGTTPGTVAAPAPETLDAPTTAGVWYPSLGTPR